MANKSKKSVEDSLELPSNIDELRNALDLNTTLSDLERKQIALQSESYENQDDDILYVLGDDEEEDDEQDESLTEVYAKMKELKNVRVQLKDIPELVDRKAKLDSLADKAERYFNTLIGMTTGMEDKYLSSFVKAVTSVLQLAVDAHNKVLDADVKIVEMQIKKDKIEYDLNNSGVKTNNSNSPIQQVSNADIKHVQKMIDDESVSDDSIIGDYTAAEVATMLEAEDDEDE